MTTGKFDGSLKFGAGPIGTLYVAYNSNSLSATVRYEDEKGLGEGDTIRLLSRDTEADLGKANVVHSEKVEARLALDVIAMWWAEYGLSTLDQLLAELNRYYQDEITGETVVKVLILDPELKNGGDI